MEAALLLRTVTASTCRGVQLRDVAVWRRCGGGVVAACSCVEAA